MIRFPVLLQARSNGPPEPVRDIHPEEGGMTLNAIPLSTASLTLTAKEMIPARSLVQMFSPHGPEGVYRVRTATGGYGGEATSTIELEHAVTEIGDYLITADQERETTLEEAIRSVFRSYRGSFWKLGSFSATDRVLLSVGKENVLESMISLLEQAPSYIFTFDFATWPWTLSLQRKDTTITAEGRLSRNVTEATVSYDDSELCTRAIVEYTTGDGKNTQHLTIDADTIGQYGVVEKFVSGSYSLAEAQTVGNAYIAAHKHPSVAVNITGLELSKVTGESLDSFRPGKLYRLALPAYGITVEQNISSMTWDDLYGNPEAVEISLADVEDPVIRFLKKQQKSGKGTAKVVAKKNKEYWTKFDQTDKEITLVAVHAKENGDILQLAGLSIDANGVLQYAEDRSDPNSKYLGSKFYVQAQAISAEVTRATTSEGILSGRIAVTATAVEAEVTRATGEEGRLSGRITVNADAITAEVTRASTAENTMSGRITVNANKVGLVVEEVSGQNVIKSASIVTAINDSGSSVALSGDHVTISGDTKVSGAFTIDNGSLVVKKSAVFQGNVQLTTANSFIQAPKFTVPSNGAVNFIGTGTGENYNLTTSILKGMIKEFSVSGNTLTLTPFYGDPVNFSKATPTVYLTGSWSGRTFTVTETGSGNTYSETPTYETGEGYSIQYDSITVDEFSSAHYAYARVLSSSGQGGNVLFGFKVDASGQYSAGQTNGRNGVNIIKSAWDTTNSRATFEKSAGTASTKAVKIGASTSWQSGTFTADVKDYEDNPNGVSTGYTITTDLGNPSMAKPSIQPSTASITGRTRAGSSDISKSSISAPGYLFFDVTVRGKTLKFYCGVST